MISNCFSSLRMTRINQDIYKLFLKYGSECLWTSDSRVSRPKGTSTETFALMFFDSEFRSVLLEQTPPPHYSTSKQGEIN